MSTEGAGGFPAHGDTLRALDDLARSVEPETVRCSGGRGRGHAATVTVASGKLAAPVADESRKSIYAVRGPGA